MVCMATHLSQSSRPDALRTRTSRAYAPLKALMRVLPCVIMCCLWSVGGTSRDAMLLCYVLFRHASSSDEEGAK
jgi:hypothetical protein